MIFYTKQHKKNNPPHSLYSIIHCIWRKHEQIFLNFQQIQRHVEVCDRADHGGVWGGGRRLRSALHGHLHLAPQVILRMC